MYSINGNFIKKNHLREHYSGADTDSDYSNYKLSEEEKEKLRQKSIEQGTYSKTEEKSTTVTGNRDVSIDKIEDVDIIDTTTSYFMENEIIDIEKTEEISTEMSREVSYSKVESVNEFKSTKEELYLEECADGGCPEIGPDGKPIFGTNRRAAQEAIVKLYEACDFDDVNYKKFELTPGSYPDLTKLGIKIRGGYGISSIKIPEGAGITVYSEKNFKGSKWGPILGPNNLSCLVHHGWNDLIASMVITREAGKVELYQHCGYNGYKSEFGVGEYNNITYDNSGQRSTGARNNDLSSIKVGKDLKLTIYDGENLTGASKVIDGGSNISCLVPHGWNDKISSIKIEPNATREKIEKSHSEWVNALNASPNKIIRRICQDCVGTHKYIFWRAINNNWKNISHHGVGSNIKDLFLNTWFNTNNNLNSDFRLTSSYEDSVENTNLWTYCNYNDPGIGFPRDCGPQGYVPYQWNSAGDRKRGHPTQMYGGTRVQYAIEAPNSTVENPKWTVVYEDPLFLPTGEGADEECYENGDIPVIEQIHASFDNYGNIYINGKDVSGEFWGNKVFNSISPYPITSSRVNNDQVEIVFKCTDTGGPQMVHAYIRLSNGKVYYTDNSWEAYKDFNLTQKVDVQVLGSGVSSPHGWHNNWSPTQYTKNDKCKHIWTTDNSDGPRYFRKVINLDIKRCPPKPEIKPEETEESSYERITSRPDLPGQTLWKYVKERKDDENKFGWSGRIYNCMIGGENCGLELTDEGGAKENAIKYLSDSESISSHLTANTPDKYEYKTLIPKLDDVFSIVFEVTALNDAHIALGSDTSHSGQHYEIVLGGWGNSKSVIRYANQIPAGGIASHSERILTRNLIPGLKWEYCTVPSPGVLSTPYKTEIINADVNYWWNTNTVGNSGRSNYIGLRLTGYIKLPSNGDYRFKVRTDDGFRMKIGGNWVINSWRLQAPTWRYSGRVTLEENKDYDFLIEWYEWGGHADMELYYEYPYGSGNWNVCNKNLFSTLSQGPAPTKFWISWLADIIKVGKGEVINENTFMQANVSNYKYPINCMLVSTGWGSTGVWNAIKTGEKPFTKEIDQDIADKLCNNPCYFYGKNGTPSAKKRFIDSGMCDCSKGDDPFGCNEIDDNCAKATNFNAEPMVCPDVDIIHITDAFDNIILSKDGELEISMNNRTYLDKNNNEVKTEEGRPSATGFMSKIIEFDEDANGNKIYYQTGEVNFPDDRTYNFWYYVTEGAIYWDTKKGAVPETDNVWRGKTDKKSVPDGCIPNSFTSNMLTITRGDEYSNKLVQEMKSEDKSIKRSSELTKEFVLNDEVNIFESDILDPKVKDIIKDAWPSYYDEQELEVNKEIAEKKLDDEGGELTPDKISTELPEDAVGEEPTAGKAYYCKYDIFQKHTFKEGEETLSSARGYVKEVNEGFKNKNNAMKNKSKNHYSITGSIKEDFDENDEINYVLNKNFINCELLDPYPEGVPEHDPNTSFDEFVDKAKEYCNSNGQCSGFLLLTPSIQEERNKVMEAKTKRIVETEPPIELDNDLCGTLGQIPDGNDIKNIHEENPDVTKCNCEEACELDDNCNGWYWYQENGENRCVLNDGIKLKATNKNYYGALSIKKPDMDKLVTGSRRNNVIISDSSIPEEEEEASGISLMLIVLLVCIILVWLVINKMY